MKRLGYAIAFVFLIAAALTPFQAVAQKTHKLREADRLTALSEKLYAQGRYAQAAQAAKRALAIIEKSSSRNSLKTADALNNLGFIYFKAGDYQKAEPFFLRVLPIVETKLPPDHEDVVSAFYNLAQLYRATDDYRKAEPYFQKLLEAKEKTLGPNHIEVVDLLNELAEIRRSNGDYDRAEPLYLRALSIVEGSPPPDQSYIYVLLNNLGALYDSKGDYDRAESFYQRSLAIREKVLGRNHLSVATSLNNLALLYYNKGDYAKAEPLFARALEIRKEASGEESKGVATVLNNLASLYRFKGDYRKAETLFQRSLKIKEKILGADHLEVAESLANLAEFYRAKGDYAEAERLHQIYLPILEKRLGADNPIFAGKLNNLAALYQDKGDYDKAEPLFLRALSVKEKALGVEHPEAANTMNNLALLYKEKGDYDKAEPLFLKALAIRERFFGLENLDVAETLNSLAELYCEKGDIAQAVAYQTRCNEVREGDLKRNLASGSERQKLLYLDRSSREMDFTISLHLQSAPNDQRARITASEILLRRKGRALDVMADNIAALRRRFNPEDRALLDRLAQTRARLSALTLKDSGGIESRRAEIKNLETQVEELETQASERSAEFRIQHRSVALDAVRRAIPAESALVEFVIYNPFNARARRFDAPRYAVMVIRNSSEVLWKDLGEADAVDKAVESLRNVLRNGGSDIEKDVKPKARALGEMVMKPVLSLLENARRLFISPDGMLNLVPFDALADEDGHYLIERYEISYLSSGRDLLRLQTRIESRRPPVIMADPDFATGSGPKLGEDPFEPLNRLSATAEEADQIKDSLTEPIVLTRNEATKKALYELSSPSLLHIATHGFFLKDNASVSETSSEASRIAARKRAAADKSAGDICNCVRLLNPLLRSGLFFAGANRPGDDAVLTALEAASLDLWGTKLVTLSACDTGVGEVKNGDGVYGLRRALVLAGSESQLLSLWPVSDAGARDLMIKYYKSLKNGLGRNEALRRVQLEMLKDAKRRHPYYWASFIQSGEWANLEGKR